MKIVDIVGWWRQARWYEILLGMFSRRVREDVKRRREAGVWASFFKMLEKEAADGRIGISIKDGLVFEMDMDVWNIHFCQGPFTQAVDVKAHAYMKGVREYMNMMIAYSRGADPEVALPERVTEDMEVVVIVRDEDGKPVIVGREKKGVFWMMPWIDD